MNSLYQQLNPMQNNQFAQMYKTVRASKNPQQLLTHMAMQNPQLKQTLSLINSCGQSPKDLFYQATQRMGVNPESILSMLR